MPKRRSAPPSPPHGDLPPSDYSQPPPSQDELAEGLIAHNFSPKFFPEIHRYFKDEDRHISSQLILEVELAANVAGQMKVHLERILPELRAARAGARALEKLQPRKFHPPHNFTSTPPPPPAPPPFFDA